MRDYYIEATNIKNPIYPAKIDMSGMNLKGETVELSNYYLEVDKRPFFAICGEAHFSRMNEKLWEDEIIKMKMGGINILATYIFWNHHEEIEGQFDWSGNKNLKKYVELCKKHSMYIILRVGPFAHGEVRNGGFPDWLFGRPFDLRCNDEEYLRYTRIFFREIGEQAAGLMYKDNGPVIGIQIENEHEHASAPWEMTTENGSEWVVSGRQGPEHMEMLKKIALEEGLVTPLYTATAWGGACAPVETVFPLWGGYAFRPWMFYGDLEEHPVTAEYLYGDFHCNTAPQYYNFDPEYPAEDLPYACCEMGGGMNVYYKYRFQLPFESVGAMAQVKVGSGCNFLGYYMYHGGTNPKGKLTPYLNENAVPKFSYDYQAAVGEFGQIRKSYKQLKLQHLLYKTFEKTFTQTKTVLSCEAIHQVPEEIDNLRYVVRLDENGSGYLFINNYQDHMKMKKQKDFSVSVQSDKGKVRIPAAGYLDLDENAFCLLPINLEIEDITLKYATVQIITKIEKGGELYYFFHRVPGMEAEYFFDETTLNSIDGEGEIYKAQVILDKRETMEIFTVNNKSDKKIHFVTLTYEQALDFWKFEYKGEDNVILSEAPILVSNNEIRIEYTDHQSDKIMIFSPEKSEIMVENKVLMPMESDHVFSIYQLPVKIEKISLNTKDCSTINADADMELKRPVVGSPLTSRKIVNARMSIKFKEEDFNDCKQFIIKIFYDGDIGYAFINGKMFHDNFCNGAPWEIDLLPYKEELLEYGMYIYISPRKQGTYIDSSSAMAARFEVSKEQTAKIVSVEAKKVRNLRLEY